MAWFVLVCQFLLWLNAVPWFQWSPPCARRDTSAALIAPVCLDDAVMEEWTAETTQMKTNVVISLDLIIFPFCCPSTKTFICVFWHVPERLFIYNLSFYSYLKKIWHHFDMKITVLDNIWDLHMLPSFPVFQLRLTGCLDDTVLVWFQVSRVPPLTWTCLRPGMITTWWSSDGGPQPLEGSTQYLVCKVAASQYFLYQYTVNYCNYYSKVKKNCLELIHAFCFANHLS